MAERGVAVDHAILNRRIEKLSLALVGKARSRKAPCAGSWHMDETNIKLEGKWRYLLRPVDKKGQTIDVMLSERRNCGAAKAFMRKAIASNEVLRI